MPSQLSRLLLDLYGMLDGPCDLAPEQRLLQSLRESIPFGSAEWTHTTTSGRSRVLCTLGVPQAKPSTAPGRRCTHERTECSDGPGGFGVWSRVWVNAELGIGATLSFHRPATPFEEDERRLIDDVASHLVRVRALMRAKSRSAPGLSWEWAELDDSGTPWDASPNFTRLVRGEFPNWQGSRLPAPLTSIAPGREHVGHTLVAERSASGTELWSRQSSELERLAPRERAVAVAFAAGGTYLEIARDLGTSPATVRNQLRVVYEKLGVRTKQELAARAGPAARASEEHAS